MEILVLLRLFKNICITTPKAKETCKAPTPLCNNGASFAKRSPWELTSPSSTPLLPPQHRLITIWCLASNTTRSPSSPCQLREVLLHRSLSPRLSHLPPRHRSCTSRTTGQSHRAGSEPAQKLQLLKNELDLLFPKWGPVCC